MGADNSRKRKKNVENIEKANGKTIISRSKRIKKGNCVNRNEAIKYNKFLLKMFDSDVEIGISEWNKLLKESIIVTDFNTSIPHLRMFEKMISKLSKKYFGSELENFFTDLINELEFIDVSVITLIFEWCFILYWQRKCLLKNQIRGNLSYEIIKNIVTGVINGSARNCLIFLICCDIGISKKFFLPNSHLIGWIENTNYFGDVNLLQENIWKFSSDILENFRIESQKCNKKFKLSLIDNICLCDVDSFLQNNEINIKLFEKIHSYFDNVKLLSLFISSLHYYSSYKSKIFPYFIEILLNSQTIGDNDSFGVNLKSNKKNCQCISKTNSPSPVLDPYELIVYTMISLILSYYGIEYDVSNEFNILYEESYNILHYLTKSDQANGSSFFIKRSQNHIEIINELLARFGEHPVFKQTINFEFFQLNGVDSFVLLVFNSILKIFKSKDISNVRDSKSNKYILLGEILVTLLFLTILHPNTTDFTIIYLLKKLYQDLYSFGFLLIGSCISLLFKKDIFSDGISKRVQLNILNFRGIHVVNSHIFPYIQFFNCIYHLISGGSMNYKLVNTIFQLFEGNFLQYFNENTKSENIDKVELSLSINISLTLNSVYLKLLEFFSLNPSLCKLFFEIKFKNQLKSTQKTGLKEIKDVYNTLNYNNKPSLLDIFDKLSSKENETGVDNILVSDDLKYEQSQFEISKQLNSISMCYSTMIHILGIIYIPIIKRANMSIYKFNYNITPPGFLLNNYRINDGYIGLENVISLIQKESFEIPKQFCIEFLEEIVYYCKLTNQQNPFEIDRFIVSNALEVTNSTCKNISSFIHTCKNDKLIRENCFSCCIDSYLEYLGIINSMKTIKEKRFDYCFSKSWVNHGTIISLITLIGGRMDVYGMNKLLESEINTSVDFSDEPLKFYINSLPIGLLSELIRILFSEIKDDTNIRKESADIQRILFRSLLIYLLYLVIKNKMFEEFILKLDLENLIIRLCNLFTFRVESLSTNINNNGYFINENSNFSTPSNKKLPTDRDVEYEHILGDYYSPKSTNSKNSYFSTPKVKRITPVVISVSNKSNKSLTDLDMSTYNFNSNSYIALKEQNHSDSSIFHLKIILNTIIIIHELKLIRNTNYFIVSDDGIHSTIEEFTLDILEKTLFFLLPSNTFSKGSIFNTARILENNTQNNYLDTICECSENSEAEEIENSNENEKINSKSHFSVSSINKKAFIPFSLNEDDFSKDWYIETVISLIRYLFNNTNSIRDISSLITDIASKTVMWNRKYNKKVILKVFNEILKFTFDYFYDDLTEISLCLLRNNSAQLLSSVKFVFVALLDQNSKLINNTLNELPSIHALNELEELHDTIFLFHSITEIFDLCFEILIHKESIFSDKDNIWIKNAISFMERGIEALNTELLKMERIIVPPKVDAVDNQFTENYSENDNVYRHESEEIWNEYINNCSLMLGECEYTIELISMSWVSPNKDLPTNEKNKGSKEIDDDLSSFITFEECDEGILQGNDSYTDIKLTSHWNTFIKSLFL
ncbi:hypothetical protein FG386_000405 [Cryptosporidium ryanae]|uniref:uncharacterized protein n=1 Tax=Cryptosporidium ryanae TaxID=515981 RepID=UPI00351A4114|nr:hypothetical protein FG386_000405 [Cryptosporidium ryanae]